MPIKAHFTPRNWPIWCGHSQWRVKGRVSCGSGLTCI